MVNAAAAYMRAANLAHGVIDALTGAQVLEFGSEAEWTAHLAALGVTALRVAPNPVRRGSWGAIAAEDRLGTAVILSYDAGRFRVGATPYVGFTPSASSTSLIPPTSGNAAPSRSRGG